MGFNSAFKGLKYHGSYEAEALRYKPEGLEFDSQRCYWKFSLN